MPITGSTRLAGVAGWPVSHSRSPLLHGAWLARHGVNGVYVPLPVRPTDLAAALRGLSACGFAGVNLTIPHKIEAMALCDRLEPSAARAGAVNTLVFDARGVTGSNTDGWGFLEHLRASGADPAAGPALVLGAGGAGRAVAAALQDSGAEVAVSNRTKDRATALANDLPGLRVLPWERRDEALADVALVVNTTSLGMTGQPRLELSLARASAGLVVADIVYAPLRTPLLAEAITRGLLAIDGLGMLLHQARAGFQAWFGVLPEADRAVRDLLAADLSKADRGR
jgi:shikimate dehydrogenase